MEQAHQGQGACDHRGSSGTVMGDTSHDRAVARVREFVHAGGLIGMTNDDLVELLDRHARHELRLGAVWCERYAHQVSASTTLTPRDAALECETALTRMMP